MIWLTWRQFRAQAAAGYAAVALVGVVLAITGPRLVRLARGSTPVFDLLSRTDRNLFYAGIVLLAVAPALVGAFWGAPLVGRELEAGTHRLAWNQSITRSRWLATKLGVGALTSAVTIGLLTLAVSWWSDPIDGAVSNRQGGLPGRLTPVSFAMRGIAPVGYAVFALVLGVTLGIVLRRSLPAMAITLAVYAVVQVAVPLWVRPHLVPPAHGVVMLSRDTLDSIRDDGTGRVESISVHTGDRGDWILSNDTLDGTGQVAAVPSWFGGCLSSATSSAPRTQVDASPVDACLARLAAEGYRQRVVYQPADRFWPLQWAETALFLALSGLLTALSFWWLRTRLT
jgi:hypothetical protein